MNKYTQPFVLIILLGLALMLSSCGGGSSGPGQTTVTPLNHPQIVTASALPGAVQTLSYNTTLVATGGRAPLRWSIQPVTPTTLFVDGLTIDTSTGVVSGTSNWTGTGSFVAQVIDADSLQTSKLFTITAFAPLSAAPSRSATIREYDSVSLIGDGQNGIPPYTYTVTGGTLPSGMRLNRNIGLLNGSPFARGNFLATITIQDSFSPPEIFTQTVSIDVIPAIMNVAPSMPSRLPINVPFSGKVVVTGGTPPYTFALDSGTLPPGLGPINPATGAIAGTPNLAFTGFFTIRAIDSGSPSQSATNTFFMTVEKALGRNDSVVTATPIGNGSFNANISPYIDPPNKAPLPGDSDYYKLISVSGATVHIETVAKAIQPNTPLDTVLEIVDANGIRLTSCRQPGDVSTNFTSSCINDDKSNTLQDSALDFQVPGAANVQTTFFVHVFDWRGDARPDMLYFLNVSGLAAPLAITTPAAETAAR